MEVSIKNEHVKSTIDLLLSLDLSGKQARHVTRVVKVLEEHFKELTEEEIAINRECVVFDDEGNPVTEIKNGKSIVVFKEGKQKDFLKGKEDLFQEEFILEGSNMANYLTTVKEVLEEPSKTFNGQEMIIYGYICDQFGID